MWSQLLGPLNNYVTLKREGGVIDFVTRRCEFSREGGGVSCKCYVIYKTDIKRKKTRKTQKKTSENKWDLRNMQGGEGHAILLRGVI